MYDRSLQLLHTNGATNTYCLGLRQCGFPASVGAEAMKMPSVFLRIANSQSQKDVQLCFKEINILAFCGRECQ